MNGVKWLRKLVKHFLTAYIFNLKVKQMIEKIGSIAGAVWTALNENGAMNSKDLKKVCKIKTDKDLYLAMGWLLREDKLNVMEEGKEISLSLK